MLMKLFDVTSSKISIFIIICLASIFDAQAKNICEKHKVELANDREYRVVFGDSSTDGLILALDIAQELEPKLKALETEYKVSFTFNHFNDSKNAPYHAKEPQEIKNLTMHFLEYLLNLPNTHDAIIACSAASAAYDDKMNKFFSEKYRDIKIITMLNEENSSATLSHIFAEKLYEDIAQNLPRFAYHKRLKPMPLQCAKNITIYSELSGDNIEQTKEIISHAHPQYLNKISFKKITIN